MERHPAGLRYMHDRRSHPTESSRPPTMLLVPKTNAVELLTLCHVRWISYQHQAETLDEQCMQSLDGCCLGCERRWSVARLEGTCVDVLFFSTTHNAT